MNIRFSLHRRMWFLVPFLVLAVAIVILFILPRNGPNNADYLRSLEQSGFNKYLPSPPQYASVTRVGAWDVYRYSAPEMQCVTGGDYGLFVHKGSEDKTVVWLQPGSECWPGHPACGGRSASLEQAAAKQIAAADGDPFGPTMPDRDNPIAKWNYVLVPFCDGSFHFGDAAADFDEDGVADHWHNGLRHTSAAVSLARALFPRSKKILVAGCSAGGYGTFGAAPVARLGFPNASLYVLNASGPGLFNPAQPETFQLIMRTWNLAPLIPPGCPECNQQLIHWYKWQLDGDAKLKIGLYSSYGDLTDRTLTAMSGDDYKKLLLATTDPLHRNHPDRFIRFLINGEGHCIGDYYTKVNGVSIWSWIGNMVNDDSRWTEVLQGDAK